MSRGWLRSLGKVRSWVAERGSRRGGCRHGVGLVVEPLEDRQLLSSLLSFSVSSAPPPGTGVGVTPAVQQGTLSLPAGGVSISSVSASPPAPGTPSGAALAVAPGPHPGGALPAPDVMSNSIGGSAPAGLALQAAAATTVPAPSFASLVVGPPPATGGTGVVLVTAGTPQGPASPYGLGVAAAPGIAVASSPPAPAVPGGAGSKSPAGHDPLLSLPNPLPEPPAGQDPSAYWAAQAENYWYGLESDLIMNLPANITARDLADFYDAEGHLPDVPNPPSGESPDGPTYQQTRNSDGTTTTTVTSTNSDGSTYQQTQTRNSDGSITTTTTLTVPEGDGSTWTQTRNSDGTTTTTVTAPNGDGSVYQQTRNSDGSTTTTVRAPNGDGSVYQQTRTQNSDGSTSHTTTLTAPNADGSVYQQTQTETRGSTGTRNSTTTTLTAPNADGSVYQQTQSQTQFTSTTTTERSTTGSGGPSYQMQVQTGTGTSSSTTTTLTAPNADGSVFRQSQQQTQFSNSTTTGQVSDGPGGASYQQQTQDNRGTTSSTSTTLTAPNADGWTYRQQTQTFTSISTTTTTGVTVQLATPDAPSSARPPQPAPPAAGSPAQPSDADLLPLLADRLGVRLGGFFGNDVAAVLKAAQDGGIPANTLNDVYRYLAIRQAALTPGAPAPADLKGYEQTAFNNIRATGDPNQMFIPVPPPPASATPPAPAAEPAKGVSGPYQFPPLFPVDDPTNAVSFDPNQPTNRGLLQELARLGNTPTDLVNGAIQAAAGLSNFLQMPDNQKAQAVRDWLDNWNTGAQAIRKDPAGSLLPVLIQISNSAAQIGGGSALLDSNLAVLKAGLGGSAAAGSAASGQAVENGSLADTLRGPAAADNPPSARNLSDVLRDIVDMNREANGYTYRGDGRAPDEIAQTGFQPKGNNADLVAHTLNNVRDSYYVSTTNDPNVILDSRNLADLTGYRPDYVYLVHPPAPVDVNAAFQAMGIPNPFAFQQEIAAAGGIGTNDIVYAAPIRWSMEIDWYPTSRGRIGQPYYKGTLGLPVFMK